MKPLVLICTKDAEFYLVYSHMLEAGGFASELAEGGVEEAVRQALDREPQAVILDCQPASEAGPAVCAQLKGNLQSGALPVVALIAPGANHQHLHLLKAGVDESFVRPFAPAKLLSFLRAELAMERQDPAEMTNGLTTTWGALEMVLASRRVRGRDGQQIHLNQIEFNLLHHLIENRGNACSRDELIRAAWPDNIHVDSRTVDVHISRLRKRLKEMAPQNVVCTVRSIGYAIEEREM